MTTMTTNALNLETMPLNDLVALQNNVKQIVESRAALRRATDLQTLLDLRAIHDFTPAEMKLDLGMLKSAALKGIRHALQYLEPKSRTVWTSQGSTPKQFRAALGITDREVKRVANELMAQFLIPADIAESLALEHKRDVKAANGQVFKYADVAAKHGVTQCDATTQAELLAA